MANTKDQHKGAWNQEFRVFLIDYLAVIASIAIIEKSEAIQVPDPYLACDMLYSLKLCEIICPVF